MHYAIDNDTSFSGVNIYGSYTTADKYTTLSTNRSTAGQGDIADVVSSGPFSIAPGDFVIVAFALLADDTLTGLQQSADSAAVMYNSICFVITANITPTDATTCGASDGTATVVPTNGFAPFTFQWDSAAGNQTTQIATGLSAGIYSVTVNDAKGCTGIFTVSIVDANAGTPSASVNQHVLCFGGNDGQATSSITGGTPPYTYVWDNGDSTAATTSGLTAGDYTVKITDSAGCIVFQTITINQPPLLTGVVSVTDVSCPLCFDGSASIAPGGGTPSYSYQWKNSLGVPYTG